MASFPIGSDVILQNLSTAEYNGMKGRVKSNIDALSSRQNVFVFRARRTMAVKPANMRRCMDGTESISNGNSNNNGSSTGSSSCGGGGNGDGSGGSEKRPAKPPKAEKRLKRFRSKPTIAITQRIERAVTQRLFLVHISAVTSPHSIHGGPSITLTVLGSTGNVYDVTLSKIPHCTCPDHNKNKGNLCKHFLFVMLKVVGLPASSALVYQSAYITEELTQIIATLQGRVSRLGRDVTANEAVRRRHEEMKNPSGKTEEGSASFPLPESTSTIRKPVEGGECPICFDSLGVDLSQLTYCQQMCGTNFHISCMQVWTAQPSQRNSPTCPACRQTWVDVTAGGKKRGAAEQSSGGEGYENLGDLQGQSRIRDTSTYSRSSPYQRYRRRHW